jgi:hypothetical protein
MTKSDRTGAPASPDAWVYKARRSWPSRLGVSLRQGAIPYPLLGVALVVACGAIFMVLQSHADDRRPVLALAHTVSPGHVLSAQDLREVAVAVDPSVPVVATNQAASVVGKTMATTVPAGSLLTLGAVGAAPVPAPGHAIAALALKPGRWPPEIGPGSHVEVVAAGHASGGWPAVVTDVTSPPNEQTTVISVDVADTAAREIAALPSGQMSVVMQSAGGR